LAGRARVAAGLFLIGASLAVYLGSLYLAYTGYIAASILAAAIGSLLLLTGADLLKE